MNVFESVGSSVRRVALWSLCAGFACGAGAGDVLTSQSYVRDSIHAQWDAIDNVGVGVHKSKARTWCDLAEPSRAYDYYMKWEGAFSEKGFAVADSKNYFEGGDQAWWQAQGDTFTWEAFVTLADSRSNNSSIMGNYNQTGTCGMLFGYYDSTAKTFAFGIRNTPAGDADVLFAVPAADVPASQPILFTYVADGANGAKFYTNGVLWASSDKVCPALSYNGLFYLGKNHKDQNAFRGTIHAARIYRKALTAGEVTANCRVDFERFCDRGVAEGIAATATSATSFSVTAERMADGDAKLLWWRSPTLVYTNDLVETDGVLSNAVDALVAPGVRHYAKVVILGAGGETLAETETASFCPPFAPKSALPENYQQIEFIESSGEQGIDFGVNMYKYIGLSLDFSTTWNTNQEKKAIFGTDTYNSSQYTLGMEGGKLKFYGSGVTLGDLLPETRYVFDYEPDSYQCRLTAAGVVGPWVASGNSTSSGKGKIFNLTYDSNKKATCRIHGVKIFDANETLREMVPCYCTTNGVVGMYDVVGGDAGGKVFYPNVNGNVFARGPAVADPKSVLEIAGEPLAYGAANPAYGTLAHLAAGDTFDCVAPVAYRDGTLTAVCTGWQLYAQDASGAWVAGASGAGNVCRFVKSATRDRLVWQWSVRSELAVGEPQVVEIAGGAATLDVAVGGIGFTAESAELKIIYGVSPNALTGEQIVEATLTNAGVYRTTVGGLLPDRVYYFKSVLTTSDGDEASTTCSTVRTAPAVPLGVGTGLWQTYLKAADGITVNNFKDVDVLARPEGADWADGASRRHELLPLAAYAYNNERKRISTLWNDYVYWPEAKSKQAGFAYVGQIYLDSGKTYQFRGGFDDRIYLKLTDLKTGEVKTFGPANSISTGSYLPSHTGWYGIDVRMWDTGGSAGGTSSENEYKNAKNFGWSEDGGVTWKILEDPGDGSLLRTTPPSSFTVRENAEGGALASVSLTFAESAEARELRVAYGPLCSSVDPADRAHTAKVADIAAGETAADYAVPADWGTADNCTMAFYFDGDPVEWSDVVYWQDYALPVVEAVTADGTGGDTLRVSGRLVSFSGESCTLTVYTGKTPETCEIAWTDKVVTLEEAGAFEIDVFEPDAASPRYIAPGEAYYVIVEAVANGRVGRSEAVYAPTIGPAIISSASTSVDRRTVTFSGAISSVGAGGAATVGFYVGETPNPDSLVLLGELTTVTSPKTVTLRQTFPVFEKTYYWQLRVVNTTAGDRTMDPVCSKVLTVRTLDTTTYTWKSDVVTGDWCDASNWTNNKQGDCFGYPMSTSATVVFPQDTAATVVLDCPLVVGTVDLKAANIALTFTGTKADVLAGTFQLGNSTHIVLDGASLASAKDIKLGGASVLTLRDGAFSVTNMYFNVTEGGNLGGGTVRLEGTAPEFRAYGNCRGQNASIADATGGFVFKVPQGGYADAPLRLTVSSANLLGGRDAGSAAPLAVSVDRKSPAYKSQDVQLCLLATWASGIAPEKMALDADGLRCSGQTLGGEPLGFLYSKQLNEPRTWEVSGGFTKSDKPYALAVQLRGSGFTLIVK